MASIVVLSLAIAGAVAVPQRLESTDSARSASVQLQKFLTVPKFVDGENSDWANDGNSIFHGPLIDHINSVQKYWRAADPRKGEDAHFSSWTYGDMRRLVPFRPKRKTGVNDEEEEGPIHHLDARKIEYEEDKIPAFFDARQVWYDCAPISNIRDQGSCGACWAFGTTSAMADRTCIHSKGKYQLMLSAHDIGGCCGYCSHMKGMCEGGEPQDGYHYWLHEGLVSGDNWMSQIGCQPYPINISIVHIPGQSTVSPQCEEQCTNTAYKERPYRMDKVRAKDVYRLEDYDTKAMQWEIMTNGPITVSYDVYADFPLYKDGVYVQTSEEKLGEHTVTVIGWGEENGIPYWTVKNSWNRAWGHHGFFKMIRGQDECRFEHEIVVGIPDV